MNTFAGSIYPTVQIARVIDKKLLNTILAKQRAGKYRSRKIVLQDLQSLSEKELIAIADNTIRQFVTEKIRFSDHFIRTTAEILNLYGGVSPSNDEDFELLIQDKQNPILTYIYNKLKIIKDNTKTLNDRSDALLGLLIASKNKYIGKSLENYYKGTELVNEYNVLSKTENSISQIEKLVPAFTARDEADINQTKPRSGIIASIWGTLTGTNDKVTQNQTQAPPKPETEQENDKEELLNQYPLPDEIKERLQSTDFNTGDVVDGNKIRTTVSAMFGGTLPSKVVFNAHQDALSNDYVYAKTYFKLFGQQKYNDFITELKPFVESGKKFTQNSAIKLGSLLLEMKQ